MSSYGQKRDSEADLSIALSLISLWASSPMSFSLSILDARSFLASLVKRVYFQSPIPYQGTFKPCVASIILTLNMLFTMLNRIPASQNRFDVLATFFAVSGFRLMNLIA